MVIDLDLYPEAEGLEKIVSRLKDDRKIKLAQRLTDLLLAEIERLKDVIPAGEFEKYRSCLGKVHALSTDVSAWPGFPLPDVIHTETTASTEMTDIFRCAGLNLDLNTGITGPICDYIVNLSSGINDQDVDLILGAAIEAMLEIAEDTAERGTAQIEEPGQVVLDLIANCVKDLP